jgi:hypothetical protein
MNDALAATPTIDCDHARVPAFADVKNHLSTERMRQTMKTDVFYCSTGTGTPRLRSVANGSRPRLRSTSSFAKSFA